MIQYTSLKHRFVTNLPDQLDPGVLYISIEYATIVHLCCCGCGTEVVTPLTPTDWNMTFDGETISLSPSVGNWNDVCRSHYIIRKSQVIVADPWSDRRIELEWQRDRFAKSKYYKDHCATKQSAMEEKPTEQGIGKKSITKRLFDWFKNG